MGVAPRALCNRSRIGPFGSAAATHTAARAPADCVAPIGKMVRYQCACRRVVPYGSAGPSMASSLWASVIAPLCHLPERPQVSCQSGVSAPRLGFRAPMSWPNRRRTTMHTPSGCLKATCVSHSVFRDVALGSLSREAQQAPWAGPQASDVSLALAPACNPPGDPSYVFALPACSAVMPVRGRRAGRHVGSLKGRVLLLVVASCKGQCGSRPRIAHCLE